MSIKNAVEALFDVKVKQVRTIQYVGKYRRVGRSQGRKAAWKKAYVTLRDGDRIDFFEGRNSWLSDSTNQHLLVDASKVFPALVILRRQKRDRSGLCWHRSINMAGEITEDGSLPFTGAAA